jgi:hypothetical protein
MNGAYPPFHRTGEPHGDFYALVFSEGTYVSPTGTTREDGFLVLYYSPMPEFTRLSFSTCTRSGQLLSYSRGIDRHDTPEFALLKAWYDYLLPPHRWKLYPADVAQLYWADAAGDHEASYTAMRRSLSSILYHLRWQAWSQQNPNLAPLFYPSAEGSLTNPLDPGPENEELFRSVLDGAE